MNINNKLNREISLTVIDQGKLLTYTIEAGEIKQISFVDFIVELEIERNIYLASKAELNGNLFVIDSKEEQNRKKIIFKLALVIYIILLILGMFSIGLANFNGWVVLFILLTTVSAVWLYVCNLENKSNILLLDK